jgi:hypothetical protein
MINFKKHSDPFGSLGIGKDHILSDICKVGKDGRQEITTCKWLNRNKQGYFCLKICNNEKHAEFLHYANHGSYELKGDYCDGIDENIDLTPMNIIDER